MKLSQKNLVYSVVLASILLLLLLGYFIYMLPSLYVDYMMEQNLKSIRQQHEAYMEQGTYEGVKVNNTTACYSIKIPEKGNSIFITGKAFSVKVTATEKHLQELLAQIKEQLKDYGKSSEGHTVELWEQDQETMHEILGLIKEIAQEEVSLPVDLDFLYVQDIEQEFQYEPSKIYSYGGNVIIIESSVEESGNRYTNYMAVEKTNESLVFSFLPVVTPEMNEIRSIVLQSVPMLGAVVLLVVLLFSQLYSRGIVEPIVRLVAHAERMKTTEGFAVQPLDEKWKGKGDEVGELADTLDELYLKIKDSYQKLEEENRRQEVFLRSSTHQLKTPIAAALLLVDGMINEIGKYKETKVYLPKVKEQLLSMRQMVEEILYLNHCEENMKLQRVELGGFIRKRLIHYQVTIGDKELAVEILEKERLEMYTDEVMISQIIDNIISNVVKYTPPGGNIQIEISQHKIRVENSGVIIPEELLPHIFDPFVSGNHSGGGHGLGLYIAAYYAKKIKADIAIYNSENSVVTILTFEN